ncbi:MAG: ribonuclease HI [Calditrichaceae bacterium]
MKRIQLFSDGACSGNPGPGGYGVILKFNEHEREFSAGYKSTTNNRMEMMAIIVGLESLNEICQVDVYSDSKYIVDAVNQGWALKWEANNWKRNKKEMAKNIDLWIRLLDLLEKHKVTMNWVKGHAGHPENERCDKLAVAAAASPTLVDSGAK